MQQRASGLHYCTCIMSSVAAADNGGGGGGMVWWRWALLSPVGVAPSRTVDVSASVNLPLHHKVQKFSSGTSSPPGWSWEKGCKTVVVVVFILLSCLEHSGIQ